MVAAPPPVYQPQAAAAPPDAAPPKPINAVTIHAVESPSLSPKTIPKAEQANQETADSYLKFKPFPLSVTCS